MWFLWIFVLDSAPHSRSVTMLKIGPLVGKPAVYQILVLLAVANMLASEPNPFRWTACFTQRGSHWLLFCHWPIGAMLCSAELTVKCTCHVASMSKLFPYIYLTCQCQMQTSLLLCLRLLVCLQTQFSYREHFLKGKKKHKKNKLVWFTWQRTPLYIFVLLYWIWGESFFHEGKNAALNICHICLLPLQSFLLQTQILLYPCQDIHSWCLWLASERLSPVVCSLLPHIGIFC